MSSLIPQATNPYIGAFIGGIVYGMVVCTASCLPYLAGYIAGVGAGFRKGISITMLFSGGRIAGYAIVGALAGLFSGLFRLVVSESEISPFQIYSSIVFGIVTVAIGVFILFKAKQPQCDCSLENSNSINTKQPKKSRWGFDFAAFSLGLSRGLILCPPLVLLLLYSVPFASPLDSISLAVLFGLGTTVSPILILGGVTGWLLNKAPLFRKWVSIAGAGILILLGIITIINSLTQL